MIKVYKMIGRTESHEVFTSPSGKTTVKVTFTKGNLDPKNRVPAKYATASPVIQQFIENSPKFGKTIFLDRTYGAADNIPDAAPAETAKTTKTTKTTKAKATLKEMPEVTTLADAATVLTAEGVPAGDFDGTVEGAQKLAKGVGITFPNLKNEE